MVYGGWWMVQPALQLFYLIQKHGLPDLSLSSIYHPPLTINDQPLSPSLHSTSTGISPTPITTFPCTGCKMLSLP